MSRLIIIILEDLALCCLLAYPLLEVGCWCEITCYIRVVFMPVTKLDRCATTPLPTPSWLMKLNFVIGKATFICLNSLLTSSAAEITMFDNYIVVYKFAQDLHFFVTGSDNENEIILASVLQGFFDAVGILLRLFTKAVFSFSICIR